ncbi:MAG: hypothetical protein R6W73_05885 [Candidatus Saliniplasma sp.]
MVESKVLMRIYDILKTEFGEQNWWPADTKFEMMVGAILTQNVSWVNVKRAIENLREKKMLNPTAIKNSSMKNIQYLIKPTGFYKQKSKRLKRLANAISDNGNIDSLLKRNDLRDFLLTIKGIGPETADSIILYAGEEPRFVVDAYTRRILKRVLNYEGTYQDIQDLFETKLPNELDVYKEYHALLVELGKKYCKKKEPRCISCPLSNLCKFTG